MKTINAPFPTVYAYTLGKHYNNKNTAWAADKSPFRGEPAENWDEPKYTAQQLNGVENTHGVNYRNYILGKMGGNPRIYGP